MWGLLIGGLISLYANYQAGEQQKSATNASLEQEQAANATNQEAIRKAQEASAPALGYFKNVVAKGTALTPSQQQYVADTRQQTGSALSSRLGGRAATAIASRAATDVNNATIDTNQARVDQAASTLANPGINSTNLILSAGQAQAADAQARGRAAREYGDINAGATLAAGNIVGQGIGQYYAGQSNQDLLDAIRRNDVGRPSSYTPKQTSSDPTWNPSYKLR